MSFVSFLRYCADVLLEGLGFPPASIPYHCSSTGPASPTPTEEPRDVYTIVIAIDYHDTDSDDLKTLAESHRNAEKFEQYIRQACGKYLKQMLVMTDSPGTPVHLQPTYDNLTREIDQFLIHKPAADFVFFFCGHGAQKVCMDGSERDGKDEYIVPCDATPRSDRSRPHSFSSVRLDSASDATFPPENLIKDNFLREHLVDKLPEGSNLFAFIDACHSGTMLDLLHDRCHRVYRLISTPYRRFVRKVLGQIDRVLPQRSASLDGVISEMATQKECGYCRASCTPTQGARVICISSCKDEESVWENSRTMTTNFLECLDNDPNPILYDLMYELSFRADVAAKHLMKGQGGKRFRMSPQLSSMHSLDMKRTRLFPPGTVFDTL